METIAISLALSRYILAIAGVYLCIHLFRLYRNVGWLVLGFSMLDPFLHLFIRFAQHKPLLAYRTTGQMVDGAMTVGYRLDVPFYGILTFVGLLLLLMGALREKHK